MVRDGIYYGVAFTAAGLVVGWLAGPWYGVPAMLLAAFFLWFFRDPERAVPAAPGVIVSPADGKVTAVANVDDSGVPRTRVSIFMNVTDVHVNRSPIAGVIRDVQYRKGLFKNAMGSGCSDCNEQNIVTVDDGGQTVVFKQIAGLIARRIIFNKRVGDTVACGERIGMIKFGSRVDVIFDTAASVQVKVGQHVAGGSSILALARVTPDGTPSHELAGARSEKGVRR
jgi:phosphatidylserine decarboxylase